MGSVFGGNKRKDSASNQAFGQLRDTFTPVTQFAGTGANALQALLSGDPTGFNAYKQATGFDPMAEAGSRGITGNAAASGMLRSGGTGKALQSFGANLQNQFAGSYMDRLLGLSNLGLGAGQLISGAGQTSTSTSKSKPGIGGFLGQVGAGVAASDRRLKKSIYHLYERDDGLSVYQYRYLNNEGPYIGVMAQEVAELKPEALGPTVNGYLTVNYGAL